MTYAPNIKDSPLYVLYKSQAPVFDMQRQELWSGNDRRELNQQVLVHRFKYTPTTYLLIVDRNNDQDQIQVINCTPK